MWISEHFLNHLHQVHGAIRDTGSNKNALSEVAEASIVYVRFKAAASEVNYLSLTDWIRELHLMVKLNYHLFLGINYLPVIFEDDHAPEKTNMFTRYCFKNLQLKPVLEEIESRSSRNEYSQLLAECHKLFCEQRLSLVSFFIGPA